MKTFVKIFLLIIATGCIFAGLDKINHTYEIAEQRYDKYISELPKGDDEININIPSEVEKYYISTSIKEIITIYICVL